MANSKALVSLQYSIEYCNEVAALFNIISVAGYVMRM